MYKLKYTIEIDYRNSLDNDQNLTAEECEKFVNEELADAIRSFEFNSGAIVEIKDTNGNQVLLD